MADDDGFGRRFWIRFIGVLIAFAIGATLCFILFDRAVYRWGFLGTFIVLAAVLLLIGWIFDRRHTQTYE